MVKKKTKTVKASNKSSSDDGYILKIVMYLIVGSQWLYLTKGTNWQLPIPYGALIALLFARHEHFKTDRRIEYAVIIVAMFIGFWAPGGLTFLL